LGHRRLGDLKAELKQFAVDARRSPQRVLDTHAPDQGAQLRVNLRPSAKRARLPTPVPTKAGPMPTDERLWTDDRDDLQDRRKPTRFEREMGGGRTRHKLPAARRKGMWMGGTIPLGYDVRDRKLIVNEAEAETVRLIFQRYLALGCVSRLRADLDRK